MNTDAAHLEQRKTNDAASITVLGIAGSARRQGNTDLLLDQFLTGAEDGGADVDKVILSRCRIAHCLACELCFETGFCAIEDEFQRIEAKILTADVIALAAPVYFWNLPGHAKILVDRSESQWARKYVREEPLAVTPAGHRRRRGVFIATAGQPEADFSGILQTVISFFDVWETDLWRDLLLEDVDEKGAILDHDNALELARRLGRQSVSAPWDDGS